MKYNLSEFFEKEPSDTHVCKFDDSGERGVFAARWPQLQFQTPLEFHIFLFRFSCIMQPYIQGIRGDELFDFFYPDEEATTRATAFHESHEFKNLDAFQWMNRSLGFASIPWLKKSEHLTSMDLTDDDLPELLAVGKAGYLTIFVADMV